MRRKSGFMAIFIGYFPLPIADFIVQHRKHCVTSKAVDAFIHARYRIKLPDGYCLELVVFYSKMKRSDYLGQKHNDCPHSVWAGSIPSIANILLICSALGPVRYGAEWTGRSLPNLIISVSWLLYFDPGVRHTYVGTLKAYLKFWPDTHFSCLIILFWFANRIRLCSVSA